MEYNGQTGYLMTEYLEGGSDAAGTSQEGGEASAEEGTSRNRQTRVLESVNLRAEASSDSERLALLYPGETVTEVESYDNGWSKVEYNGQTGYLMTEYLE